MSFQEIYIDDTGLVSDTDVRLQYVIDQVNTTCLQHGMKINIKKTKAMVIGKCQNTMIPYKTANFGQSKSFQISRHLDRK